MLTVYRIVYRTRAGRHIGAPRFFDRDKANRQRRLLLNDPDVLECRVVPAIVRPLPLLPYRQLPA